MAGPLLATKLHVPRRRRGLVPRLRLQERLNRGGEAVLTLVSAPAGFGKTTLVTEWLAARDERSPAWLSLDQRDNDPVVFWTYVLTALQGTAPRVGAGALALLQEPHASLDEVLTTLVNELADVQDDVVVVLDDYHVIVARDVHDRLGFLLEHLPPQIHVVIATRADPALPLPRLRARRELIEIRADDLRLTAEEAAAYLNDVMGLALTGEHVAALEARTEGWIAALQWRRCRCRTGTTPPASSPVSRATTVTSSTTSSRRSCSARPTRSGPSFCERPYSAGSMARCAMSSSAGTAGRRCWSASTARTCFWCRSTTACTGTAITISSPTCCTHGCSQSNPTALPNCTGGPAAGTRSTASRPRQSGTRWPAETSSGRQTWSSSPCRRHGETATRQRCATGSSSSPRRCSVIVRSSAQAMRARL